jgi:hypothetical protein
MRYSYGIVDRRKIFLYKPQLFLKSKDLLVFPSTDFQKWHGDIKEYIDGLYQIDFREIEKGKSINITELNLGLGVLHNITEELENLFNSDKVSDFSYHYVSTLDDKYKRQISSYTSDMRRCDMRIPVINEGLKYKHIMEMVNEANRDSLSAFKNIKTRKLSKKKKKGY